MSTLRLSVRPSSTVCDGRYASAEQAQLVGCRRVVTVPADGRVHWSVRRQHR